MAQVNFDENQGRESFGGLNNIEKSVNLKQRMRNEATKLSKSTFSVANVTKVPFLRFIANVFDIGPSIGHCRHIS